MITANLKSLILAALTIFTGALFWFFYVVALETSSGRELQIVAALLLLSMYLITLCLGFLLYRTPVIFIGAFTMSILPLFLFLEFSWLYAGAIVVLVLAGIRSFNHVKDEILHRTDFSVPELLRRGLPYFLTFFSIMLALLYYGEAGRTTVFTTQRLLSQPTFNRILAIAQPSILERVLPGFNPEDTIDEYIIERLKKDAEIDITTLSSQEQDTILSEARNQLSVEFKINMTGKEYMKDMLYNLILARGEHYIDPYRSFVPFAFALGFFLFLRAVAFPYGWLIIFATWGIIKILVRWSIVARKQENTVQEKMAWS